MHTSWSGAGAGKRRIGMFMLALSMGFTVGCAIASAMMAFRALYLYMKLASQRQKAHREDYRLIVYAILSLTAQVALAAFFAIDVLIPGNTDPVSQFARRNFPYIVSFLSLASPFYLLSTCKSVRVVYARLFCASFMPDPHENNSTVVFTSSGSCKQTRVFVTHPRPLTTSEPAAFHGFRGRRVNTI
ncbi:hypothetical protein AAVH_29593 [Aphelenchoides avenae]|nr:hypothetical protein AAVH_29593 [Aphelenchus avenae]